MTIIHSDPVIENYITSYMEDTQVQINDYIHFDQFKTIQWERGLPLLMVDFLKYLTD